jgi:hypothetical protein
MIMEAPVMLDGDTLTIKEYLHKLLSTLWDEGESFNGKRPFGNSGWEYDIYTALVKCGAVDGTLDKDEYIEDFNESHADWIIIDMINEIFGVNDER